MRYGIITTIPSALNRYDYDLNQFVDVPVPANTIVNIIEYDGVSEFNPPANTILKPVSATTNIGDLAS